MMKKSSFTALLLGTLSGVLFAIGMCMALIAEWNAFTPGVVLGCTGDCHHADLEKNGTQGALPSVRQACTGRSFGCCRRNAAGCGHVLLHGMAKDAAGDAHRRSGDRIACMPDSLAKRRQGRAALLMNENRA